MQCGPQPGHSVRGHYMQRLENILTQNYVRTGPLALVKQAQAYYNTHLRNYQRDVSLRKPWRKRVIWEHIHLHRPTTRTITYETVRVLYSMMRELKTRGLRMRPIGAGDDNTRLDFNNSRLYLMLLKTMGPWLNKWEALTGSDSVDGGGGRKRK